MGFLMLIGVAMFVSLAIGGVLGEDEDQDGQEDIDGGQDTNGPDLIEAILDVGEQEQQEPDGNSLEMPPPNIIFSDLSEANWDAENYQLISPNDLSDQTDDNSQALHVVDDEAAEAIDVSAWSHAIVYSGEGDTVYGGNDHLGDDQFAVIATGGSVIEGGDGDGIFIALNDGNIVQAGAGNDLLLSNDGAANLDGEAGNDTIYATHNAWVVPSASSQFEDYFDTSADTISGGSGDDVIVAASGDIVNSGSGSDEIFLFGYQNAVLDFEVGIDSVVSFIPEEPNLEGAAQPIQEDLFELVHDGTFLQIRYDGMDILSVPYDSDLNVAISNQVSSEDLTFVMLGDEAFDGADIVFMYYPTVGS